MKEVREMWRILGVLFEDKKKAEFVEDGKAKVTKVYVVVDKGTGKMNGVPDSEYTHWIFTSKKSAEEEARENNK